MTRIFLFCLLLGLAGCSGQHLAGQNPIIQMQAERLIISNLQIAHASSPGAAEISQILPDPEEVEAAPSAAQPSTDHESLQNAFGRQNIRIEAPPKVAEESQPEAETTALPSDIAEKPLDDSVSAMAPQQDLNVEPQSAEEENPAAQPSSRRPLLQAGEALYGWGEDAAELAERLEQGALAAEEKVSAGWFSFVDKLDDYRHGISDWWLRRRGFKPSNMR